MTSRWDDYLRMTRRSASAQAAFGSRVRELRQARGWSLERLAEASGLHWTYVGSVERGERNLTLNSMTALAYGLGVHVRELVSAVPGPHR